MNAHDTAVKAIMTATEAVRGILMSDLSSTDKRNTVQESLETVEFFYDEGDFEAALIAANNLILDANKPNSYFSVASTR